MLAQGARTLASKLISLRHHQALSAWRDGHRCLALADEAGAIEAFQTATLFDPDLWQAALDLGRLLHQRGANESALAILADVVACADVPEAHLAFAYACRESGDHVRAATHYRVASLSLGDSDPGLYYDWAQTALAMDDFRQAERSLKRFLHLRPTDARALADLQAMPRLKEFPGAERHTAKAVAYIQNGTLLLGTASDDGIDIPILPSQPLGYMDLAVIAMRFVGLATAMGWQWDGYVTGTRSIRPWAQALSSLTGHPVIAREARRPGQRLLHLELNWCEAAATRLADTRSVAGEVFGMALGVKFGARPTNISAVMGMATVPWYRVGTLCRDVPASRLYLVPDTHQCVSEILAPCQRLAHEPSNEQIAYYHRQHRAHSVTKLALGGN